jgi:hypothetical protein
MKIGPITPACDERMSPLIQGPTQEPITDCR